MPTTLVAGNNGMKKVVIDTAYGVAEVYLQGATVTRYATKGAGGVGGVGGREVIFLSKSSSFAAGKAIRGGVPVCWPWFGPHPTDAKLPQHGIARNREWTATHLEEGRAVLELSDDAETRKLFPYSFRLRMVVTVGGDGLSFALEATNTGGEAFEYGEALHTYFHVPRIDEVRVTGLTGKAYVDKVDGGAVKQEAAAEVGLVGEVDRVYRDTFGPHEIRWPGGKVTVHKWGSRDTVLWNPAEKKAESLADLAGGQWPGFVCVEAVNTGGNRVRLEAGETRVTGCRVVG